MNDDPTISVGMEFLEYVSRYGEGCDVDSITKEKKFTEFKKSIQDARLKSASSPSYFITTINMNSLETGVTDKRRKFISILFRSFFSAVIFCQELPGYFEEQVVAECGTAGYKYVKNGNHSAVIWREEDFEGETEGLETTDTWIRELRNSSGSDASQLLSRIAMVKLTSKSSKESVLAVSWHGRRHSTQSEFKSLTTFLAEVIEKKEIPSYIIGGDFNLITLDMELAKDVAVSSYEMSPRQKAREQKSGTYIPYKDNFVTYPNKKLRVSYVRPFLFEDEESVTSDLSKEDQGKVQQEMANATDKPPKATDMLDHDPIIGVLKFTSSGAVKTLAQDFERVAIADTEQH